MKLSTLIEPNFHTAVKKLISQDVPLSAAFKLKGIIKRCDEEIAKYEEVRKVALEKLGDRDEQGNLLQTENGSVKLSQGNMQKFAVELSALLSSEVDVGKLKISDLGDKVNLSMSDLLALGDLIAD
jgi:hypothetical protein